MAIVDKKNFLGGLNTDTEQRLVPQGDYRDAVNIRVGESEGDDVGAIENVRGSEFIINDFHPGVQTRNLTCIGTYEDQVFDRIIYLVADSSDTGNPKHSIYEYNLKVNRIDLILRSRYLNFSKHHHVYGMNVIAHEEPFAPEGILYWTDDFNQPRKLNIARAKIASGTANVTQGVYRSVMEVVNGTPTYHRVVTPVVSSLSVLNYSFASQADFDIKINAIDQPPLTPPTFYLDTDPDFPQNNMWGKIFEFKYRYVYDTNEKSAFSPTSLITTAYNYAPGQNTDGNDFNKDNRARISYNWGHDHVKEIEICARIVQQSEGEGFSTDIGWFVAETLERGPFQGAYSTGTYDFYNDKPYKLIPPSETAKLFDDVPHKAKAQEIIDGNRLVYGNVVNGYDSIQDVNISLEEDFESEFLDENGDPLGGTFSFTQTDEVGVEVKENYSENSAPYSKSYYIELTFPNTPAMENIEVNLEVNKKLRGTLHAEGPFINLCGGCDNDEFVETEISFDWNRIYNLGPGSPGKTGAELAQDFYDDFLTSYSTVGDIMNANNSRYNVNFPCSTFGPCYQGGGVRWDVLNEDNGWGNEVPSSSNWHTITKFENDMSNASNLADYQAQDISDRIHVDGNKVYISRTDFQATLNSDDGYGMMEMWLDYTDSCINHDLSWSVADNGNNTNDIISYTLGADQISQSQIFMSSFKTGANHKFGIVYYDEYNRSSSVQIPKYSGNHNIYLKSFLERQIFGNNANGGVEIKWTLNHKPPDWAHHYQWVYAGNTTISDFEIVGTLGVIDSGTIFTSNGHPLKKTYLVDASELYLNNKDKAASTINWEYQEGDRVRFVLQEDANGNVGESFANNTSPGTAVDFKILGVTGEGEYKDIFEPGEQDSASDITTYMNALHSDLTNLITEFESADDAGSSGETVINKKPKTTSKFLILEKEEWLNSNIPANSGKTEPPALKGCYIEIYRPSKSADDEDVIFYEFGELFGIGLDANGNRVHLGLNGLHQSFDPFGGLITPAQGVFRNGDTYMRIRLAHHNGVDGTFIESFHQSDYFKSDFWAKGRPNRYDNQVYQKRRKSTVYYSEPFMPDTNINGLSTFNSSGLVDLPFQEYNVSLGSIQKLFAQDNALIIFQEDKVSRSVVERNIIYNADGSGQLVASNSVLSAPIAYSGEYGIGTHPESFAEYGGRIYFYDLDRSAVLRLSQNGLTAISENFMKDYFNDKSQDIKKNNKNVKIPGIFDIKKGEYILTFNGISSLQQVDLCEMASTGEFDPDAIYQLGDVVTFDGVHFTLFQLVDSDGNEYEGQAPYDIDNTFWMECSGGEDAAGCTDPDAANYNPSSLVDDGSCYYPCLGIVDDLETAVVSGSVITQPETVTYGSGYVLGNGDGSLQLQLAGGSEPYYVILINESGFISYTDFNNTGPVFIQNLPYGNYTLMFMPNDDGSTEDIVEGIPFINFFGNDVYYTELIEFYESNDSDEAAAVLTTQILEYIYNCGVMVEIEIPLQACTDPSAFNYVEEATIDDGACVTEVLGCPDPTALNYFCDENPSLCEQYDTVNPGWTITNDGSCEYPIPGCTDPGADNYNPLATEEDGSCTYCSTFSLSITDINHVTTYGGADGSYLVEASGGTSPYNIDNPINPNAAPAGTYTVTATDADGCTESINVVINEPSPTEGCTDSTAINYDSSANLDDGTCVYCGFIDSMVSPSVVQPTSIGGDGTINAYFALYPSPNTTIQTLGGSVDIEVLIYSGLGQTNLVFSQTMTANYTSGALPTNWHPNISVPGLTPGSYEVVWTVLNTIAAGCSVSEVYNINSVECGDSGSPTLFYQLFGTEDLIQTGNNIPFSVYNPTSVDGGNSCCNKGIVNSCDGNGSFFIDHEGAFASYGSNPNTFWDFSDLQVYTGNTLVALYDPSGHDFSGLSGAVTSATIDVNTVGANHYRTTVGSLAVGNYYIVWTLYDADGNAACVETVSNINIACAGCTDDGTSASQSPLYNLFNGTPFNPIANNFNDNATIDDGSCTYTLYGCTDQNSGTYGMNGQYAQSSGTIGFDFNNYSFNGTPILNYPGVNLIDDGSCLYYGCTDPDASNYDSSATQNGTSFLDGTDPCIYIGCTDSSAENYDPAANSDDGSCYYCDDGLGDILVNIDLDYGGQANSNTLTVISQSSSVPYSINIYNGGGYVYSQTINSVNAQSITLNNLTPGNFGGNWVEYWPVGSNPYAGCPVGGIQNFAVLGEVCPNIDNGDMNNMFIYDQFGNQGFYVPSTGTPNHPNTFVLTRFRVNNGTTFNNFFTSLFPTGVTIEGIYISSIHNCVVQVNGQDTHPNNTNGFDYDGDIFNYDTFDQDSYLQFNASGYTPFINVLIPYDAFGTVNNPTSEIDFVFILQEPDGDLTTCKVTVGLFNVVRHDWGDTSNTVHLYTGEFGMVVMHPANLGNHVIANEGAPMVFVWNQIETTNNWPFIGVDSDNAISNYLNYP